MSLELANRGRPLRVDLLRPTLGQGGADQVTLTLVRHLDRTRFRPRLILMRREGALLDRVPEDVDVVSPGAANLAGLLAPLVRVLRADPPDVLFSTSGGTNPHAVLARILLRGRFRVVLSERNVVDHDRRWEGAILRFVKRWTYRYADTVTAVSARIAEQLRSFPGLEEGRVVLVHNPVVLPELEELAAGDEGLEWLSASTPTVLAVGRLVEEKGFDLLLEAFSRLDEDPAPRLVILGEGPLRADLIAQAAALGLADRVNFPGYLENPFPLMAGCAVFVLSSRAEGLPGVLIQALYCGAAVIAADCGSGVREIVTDERDGLIVPKDDPVALGEALARLLRDDALRRQLAAHGRESTRRFALDAVLPRYEAILEGDEGLPVVLGRHRGTQHRGGGPPCAGS